MSTITKLLDAMQRETEDSQPDASKHARRVSDYLTEQLHGLDKWAVDRRMADTGVRLYYNGMFSTIAVEVTGTEEGFSVTIMVLSPMRNKHRDYKPERVEYKLNEPEQFDVRLAPAVARAMHFLRTRK